MTNHSQGHAKESMITKIYSLFFTATSCECGRSISVLRRLKTDMRSCMGQERLTSLVLLHIHYDMELNVDNVVDIFSRKHPRRMMLADIPNDGTNSTALYCVHILHRHFHVIFQ